MNFQQKIKPNDMVLIKTHVDKAFEPKYKGPFRVVKLKGNQVEVMPAEGGPAHFVHITDVKYILPCDDIISKIPDYTTFGRYTKLSFNPSKAEDLQWQLATVLNTAPTTTLTYSTATTNTTITT